MSRFLDEVEQDGEIYWGVQKCLDYLNLTRSCFSKLRVKHKIDTYNTDGNKIYFKKEQIESLRRIKIITQIKGDDFILDL